MAFWKSMVRAELLGEFARFACIGALGFLVDSGVLYAGLWVGLGLYFGRLVSYLASATFSWYWNRSFTFRSTVAPSIREWLHFLVANAVGGLANLAVYGGLVTRFAVCATYPVLAVGAGAVVGMAFNYTLSRHAVFRRP